MKRREGGYPRGGRRRQWKGKRKCVKRDEHHKRRSSTAPPVLPLAPAQIDGFFFDEKTSRYYPESMRQRISVDSEHRTRRKLVPCGLFSMQDSSILHSLCRLSTKVSTTDRVRVIRSLSRSRFLDSFTHCSDCHWEAASPLESGRKLFFHARSHVITQNTQNNIVCLYPGTLTEHKTIQCGVSCFMTDYDAKDDDATRFFGCALAESGDGSYFFCFNKNQAIPLQTHHFPRSDCWTISCLEGDDVGIGSSSSLYIMDAHEWKIERIRSVGADIVCSSVENMGSTGSLSLWGLRNGEIKLFDARCKQLEPFLSTRSMMIKMFSPRCPGSLGTVHVGGEVKEWDLRVGRMVFEYEARPQSSCLLRSCDVDEDQTVIMACM
eukprot:TRINITY_DN2238_c3_g1_i3.p1 TRINITY_DN2238_c3_g1~~TRINITY_DN2238_c3_g1_i3.p1  ORF type:complete len:378 (-),score=58.83 TRINITY_DN2238_c3_g1_i3:39-1172(-)